MVLPIKVKQTSSVSFPLISSLSTRGSQPYSESTVRQAISLQKSLEPNVGSFPNLHNPISHLFRRFATPAGCQRQVIVISGGNERFTTAICKLANDNTHNTRWVSKTTHTTRGQLTKQHAQHEVS